MLRPIIASYGPTSYDLARVAAKAVSCCIPIHVSYPLAMKHFELVRGKKPLEVIVLEPSRGKHVGLFADGPVVAFGMTVSQLEEFRRTISDCESETDKNQLLQSRSVTREACYTTLSELSTLGFSVPESVTTSYVDEGQLNALVLENHDARQKLPFMYCLAELVHIEAMNAMLLPILSCVMEWQSHIQEKGTLPFSLVQARVQKAQLSRLVARQARVVSARQQIFWDGEFNALRAVFNQSYDNYELYSHNAELKDRLDSVTASLQYMVEEAHQSASERLEWVIVALIFVELLIALELVPSFFRRKHGL